ncbi:hepatic leukemia factor [Plutella xylostella]|uniref:hepatic leukemia factor n=1 Tax=Plutella xylostella TaxID=51655 RepID=UPI00203275EC|nr:hepatic leukemia factor [Plutella xylostella]
MSFWRPFEKQIKVERTEDNTEENTECYVQKLQHMVHNISREDLGSFASVSPPASSTSSSHHGEFGTRDQPGLSSSAHWEPHWFETDAAFATYPTHSASPALMSSPYWTPQPDIATPIPGYYEHAEVSTSPVKRKQKRPFTAMTAALPVPSGSAPPDVRYEAFRSAMLDAIRARNGGSLSASNPRMRRAVRGAAAAGAGYQARRERNNAAAKRSRDLRRAREDELAIRAAFLEQDNAQLRRQIHAAALCTDCHTSFD